MGHTTNRGPGGASGSSFVSLCYVPFRWWFLSQILSASGDLTQVAARGDEPRGRPVALLGRVAAGFTSIWMVARANTLVQLHAEPAYRGRVMGAWTMALPGMNPVTGITMGVLAEVADARTALTTAGALVLTVGATSWRTFGRDR